MLKLIVWAIFINSFFVSIVMADDESQEIHQLMDQLQGKGCYWNEKGEKETGNIWITSHFRENCQVSAAFLIGNSGKQAREAIPLLIAMLKSTDNEDTGDGWISVRAEAARALGKIGDEKAIIPLLEFWENGSAANPPLYKSAVLEALGDLGIAKKEIFDTLQEGMKNPDASIRRCVAQSLGKIKSRESISLLMQLLDDHDDWVRRYSIESLGEFGPQAADATPKLIQILKSSDKDAVKGEAILTLGNISNESALSTLKEIVEGKNERMSRMAKKILVRKGILNN